MSVHSTMEPGDGPEQGAQKRYGAGASKPEAASADVNRVVAVLQEHAYLIERDVRSLAAVTVADRGTAELAVRAADIGTKCHAQIVRDPPPLPTVTIVLYRYGWAYKLWLDCRKMQDETQAAVLGLLFGYSPSAVAEYMTRWHAS